MTKRQLTAYRSMYSRLEALGLDAGDIDILSRAAKTLHRWAERECNGEVERDEDTGKVYGTNAGYTMGKTLRWRVPDRETGALQRVHTILKAHPDLWYYHQGDPRGCSLYVGSKADVPDLGHLDSLYTRGVAIF